MPDGTHLIMGPATMDLMKYLSKRDACDLLEIVSRGLDCRSEDDFRDLVFELKNLILFESALCGYQQFTEVISGGEISEQKMVSIDFPQEFLEYHNQKLQLKLIEKINHPS